MGPDPLSIPLRRIACTLHLTRDVHLPVYHGYALHGLVTRSLGCKPFPRQLAVHCCERWSVPRQAGQPYRFGLVGLGPLGIRLLDRAQEEIALRGRTPHRGGAGTLDGCYELTACEEVPPPPHAALARALASETGPIGLRFRTPLYLRRPRHRIRGGLTYVNREEFPPAVFLRGLARRAAEAIVSDPNAALPDWESWLPPIPESLEADSSRMINISFRPPAETLGVPNRTASPIEGVQGLLRLTGLPDEWLPFIVLGSAVQLGSGIGYGQGRYEVTRRAIASETWCQPAISLLEAAFSAPRLAAAVQRVRDNLDVRHDGWMPEVEVLDEEVEAELGEALGAEYRPSDLRGALIPRKAGGVRALAIPPPAERVLQRAAFEVLDADLDQLFEASSFAYRKGRSVRLAALAVRRAQREGFLWVLDADITAFFDNVDWEILAELLEGALAGDPLAPLVLKWIRAPVRLEGHTYVRTRGLPQGSPLSPFLANLYLDALDEHLVARSFRVVRYADDFLVLCQDEQAARIAKTEVERELAALGLTLNEAKTELVPPRESFRFLGLQFGPPEPEESPGRDRASPVAIPSGSWLENVPLAAIQRAADRLRHLERNRATKPAPPQSGAGEADPLGTSRGEAPFTPAGWLGEKRPVIVALRDVQAMMSGEKLVVRRADGSVVSHPLRGISHLTFLGATRLSFALALRCADLGIPVFCCRANGALRAMMAPPPEWVTLRRQLQRADDPAFCLAFARPVVSAKLHNAATLLVRFGFAGASERAAELRTLRDAAAGAASLESLMGYEGRGARCYFDAWAATLDPAWRFTGRKKHPAPDPVNALLSFGYTSLYHHVTTALLAAGLDPRVGFLHRERGLHQALASDVQEEFRFLAESVVWNLIQRRQVLPEHFTVASDGIPLQMSDSTRRLLLRAMESRLLEEFTPPDAAKQSYLEFLSHQARTVSATLGTGDLVYIPMRLKA